MSVLNFTVVNDTLPSKLNLRQLIDQLMLANIQIQCMYSLNVYLPGRDS